MRNLEEIKEIKEELNLYKARLQSLKLEDKLLTKRRRQCRRNGVEFSQHLREEQVRHEINWAEQEIRRLESSVSRLKNKL